MNADEDLEKKDVTSHLYKIVPDARSLLLTALGIYETLPIKVDRATALIAKHCLDIPIDEMIQTAEPLAPTSITQHSDPLREARWANALEALRRLIIFEMSQTQDIDFKQILQRILNKVNETTAI